MRKIQYFMRNLWFALALLAADAALADHLAPRVGPVILTINGAMTQGNTPGIATFDLESLRRIGAVSFATSTPWTEGVQSFTGVPLNQLLVHIGATSKSLKVTALNEYQIEVPASDAKDGGPILAWEQNGKLLSVRDKGPLWLIYPFDADNAFQTEEIHARAVWQVVQFDLMP